MRFISFVWSTILIFILTGGLFILTNVNTEPNNRSIIVDNSSEKLVPNSAEKTSLFTKLLATIKNCFLTLHFKNLLFTQYYVKALIS